MLWKTQVLGATVVAFHLVETQGYLDVCAACGGDMCVRTCMPSWAQDVVYFQSVKNASLPCRLCGLWCNG